MLTRSSRGEARLIGTIRIRSAAFSRKGRCASDALAT